MNVDRDPYAHSRALQADISQLQSAEERILEGVNAAAESRAIARCCHEIWMHLQTIDIFLHDLLVEDGLTSDARAADPLEAIRMFLASAETQVQGVMSNEYEVDIAAKRLRMSLALAGTIMEQLADYVDTLAQANSR